MINQGENVLTTQHTPKVSVIMNCLNCSKYLREAIDSVYAQTYEDWEIIFWDNASTDNSAEIIKSYDERLRYFKSEKTYTLGKARNLALKEARGEYIAILDCDDIWLPDNLEKQIKCITSGDYALSYGGVIQIDCNGKQRGRYVPTYKSGNVFNELLKQFDINVPAVMIRKSALIDNYLNFDEKIIASEEYCLFMQLAVDHDFCSMADILAKYRIHDGALTNKSISKWAEEREYTLNIICNKHPEIRGKYPEAFKEAFARASYYRARYYMFMKNRRRAIREMASVSLVSLKYFILFLITLLPIGVWDIIHKQKSKRNL